MFILKDTYSIGLGDSTRFAKLSADYNPLHINEIAARRTMFGSTVCHGIHILLKALDSILFQSDSVINLSRLKVVFRKPLRTGQHFRVKHDNSKPQIIKIIVYCESEKILTASIHYITGKIAP